MGLLCYLILLIGAVLLTLVLVVRNWGYPTQRSLKDLLVALLPFLGIGVMSLLLMSATGSPCIEWVVPALAVLAIGLTCKSDRLFTAMRTAMFLVACVLCVLFTQLVHTDFTAVPAHNARISKLRQSVALKAARTALEQAYSPDRVLPEGPVASLLSEPALGVVVTNTLERRWFTPITRLYQVKHGHARVWYPGGRLDVASAKLGLRVTN